MGKVQREEELCEDYRLVRSSIYNVQKSCAWARGHFSVVPDTIKFKIFGLESEIR